MWPLKTLRQQIQEMEDAKRQLEYAIEDEQHSIGRAQDKISKHQLKIKEIDETLSFYKTGLHEERD